MRAIDADPLLKKVEKILPWAPYRSAYAQGIRYCMELVSILIKDAPTIEPERKNGKWIYLDDCANAGYFCDQCHKKVVKDGWSSTVKKINFCPSCGADMRGE